MLHASGSLDHSPLVVRMVLTPTAVVFTSALFATDLILSYNHGCTSTDQHKKGARGLTNVPAQSLTMMNDPLSSLWLNV
ncbi:MAG: hypothetical protein Ct9H300mP7_0060 [Verrucomicrobiota bacterium]|nr:MAG: hypothetical protein Ct9H300mP7_0060 [Verrucomicrobiota bacterium]